MRCRRTCRTRCCPTPAYGCSPSTSARTGAPAGEAHYSVIFDDQLRLGDADRGFAFGGSTAAPDQVGDLVQRMVAGTADSDITPQLRSLGIGYVWVTGATTEEIARIDNTPALGTASGSETTTVWQLQPAVTRVTVAEGEQTTAVDALPPGGRAGRWLTAGSDSAKRSTRAGGPAPMVSP